MLSFAWHEYRGLYLVSDERVRILLRTAPSFFRQMHGVLWDALIMSLCVLDAKASVSGQDQASFEGMFAESAASIDADPEYGPRARSRLAEFHRAMPPLRAHRDKRIAHGDMDGKPLPVLGIEELELAIMLAFKTFNCVDLALKQPENGFLGPLMPGDCDAVVHALESMERFGELKRWCFQNGTPAMTGKEVIHALLERFLVAEWKGERPREEQGTWEPLT